MVTIDDVVRFAGLRNTVSPAARRMIRCGDSMLPRRTPRTTKNARRFFAGMHLAVNADFNRGALGKRVPLLRAFPVVLGVLRGENLTKSNRYRGVGSSQGNKCSMRACCRPTKPQSNVIRLLIAVVHLPLAFRTMASLLAPALARRRKRVPLLRAFPVVLGVLRGENLTESNRYRGVGSSQGNRCIMRACCRAPKSPIAKVTSPIAVVHLLLAFPAMATALGCGIGDSFLHTQ
jgi:hypothetical protein